MAQCVNITHPDFVALANELGFNMAHSLTVDNKYKVPTVDEAVTMIRGTKIKQFKSAMVHIRNLKSPTVEDLLKGFGGIVKKYGNDYYVVNGTRISDVPTELAAREIEDANVKFLEAVNDSFGNIFKLSGKLATAEGIKVITGDEPVVAAKNIETLLNKKGELKTDSVKMWRDDNKTMSSAYLTNAGYFAKGNIESKSLRNIINLPYANKSIARKLEDLRTKFDEIEGSSKAAKEQKAKLTERMFEIADKAFAEFKEAIKTNLRSIFDRWDSKLISRSRHWYDGANRIAQNFANTYQLSVEATSGIIAVLSPQNEWFNNISAAHRVMDIMQNHFKKPVTAQMFDHAAEISKGEPFESVIRGMKEQYSDKTIGDMLSLGEANPSDIVTYQDLAANLLRIVDLNVHSPEVTAVSPEGVAAGIKINASGLVRFAWGSSREIYKAISIYQDPSNENISEKLGMGSKVRNFYNNIANPNSELGEVTVDTHAVAAAFLNIISAEDASGLGVFRTGGHVMYSTIKEAYQELAKEKGLKPREVQSITWEALRLMIDESDKTPENREFLNDIWKQVQNKKITHEQAIDKIFDRFKFRSPQWDRATNQRGNTKTVRTVKTSIQQGERNGFDIRGQQLPIRTGTTSMVGRDVKQQFVDAINKKSIDKFGKPMFPSFDNPGISVSLASEVERLEDKECKANKCETNAFEFVKKNPKRYFPVGGYFITSNDFPVEHWWVYDKETGKQYEITPNDSPDVPADYVKGYVGVIETSLNDAIENANIVWDVDFFKGGNVQSMYLNKIIAAEPVDLLAKAKDAAKDITNDMFRQPFIDNIETSLREIAEQLHGTPGEVETTRKVFGNTIADIALQLHPKVAPGKQLFSKPNAETKVIAEAYKKEKNINTPEGVNIYALDTEYSKKIADAFDAMENNPTDPIVKAAYEAMAQETMDQFYAIQKAGYIVEIFEGTGEPYKNSQEMIKDVTDNKHQYILSTEKDFGQTAITDEQREQNPLLRDSGATDVNGKKLLINDVFRYVHDFFGHTARGNSFGAVGEENAWDEHARMYTGLARRAMTAETRGQNSWVNFGPHMRNEDGSIKTKDDPGYLDVKSRPYADQKSGLLPEEFSTLAEEKGQDRAGVKPAPEAIKVEIDEQLLSDLTQDNQDNSKPDEGWKPVDDADLFQKINDDRWTHEQKKRFSLNHVINLLKTKFNVDVITVNEPGSYWRGKYSKGRIIINEAYVTPDTPFHELLHPFIDLIKKENPALYTELMEELKNSPEGKEIIEYVKRAYPELSEDEMWDEALVQRLGRLSGEQYLEKEGKQTLFGKFIDWIKTMLAKMGIGTQGFKTNMSLQEFSELIVNPSFVYDLNRKIQNENHAERYSKLSNTFDEVIDRVRQKLKADASSRTKEMTEETSRRKFFSGKTAEALAADPRDLKAIDNFIISSATNLKKLNEKFQEFKDAFDKKATKSPDDLAKLGKLLNEIEDCVTLYEDVDTLIDAVLDEFPDTDDAIGNLKKNYSKEASLINGYKAYAKELIVNWLFPHGKSAINKALATDKPFTVVSKSTYEAVQKELQSKGQPTKRQILEEAFKRELASYMTTAKKDASAITQWLGPLLHSRDPLSALIARAVIDEYTGALKKGLTVQDRITKAVRQVRGLPVLATNKDHFNFYSKYLRQAISYEYSGIDEKGEHNYKEVKRWAFHEEYKWDEFYKEKRKHDKDLGPSPSKHDTIKYAAWKAKQDAWYANNTVKVTVNGKDAVVPAAKYKNAEFVALQSDKVFTELYRAYKEANNKVGKAGLKYGIIPQSTVPNFKVEKGKIGRDVIEKVRLFIGEEDQVYFAQKNNLKEKKSVPVPFTRLLDENELSFDLLNSVAKYAVSSEKYNSMSNIEPHVNILKNFIGGNASLAIDPRQVVKVSANGIKALSKSERKAMQVEAERINSQLDGFLNDVVYGQPMAKQSVEMFNSKFKVEDKNGKVDIIKGFSDVTEFIGIPDLDYAGFKVGEERKLKDYKVTMLRKDWNWSVKKSANTLGLITAFQQLALNPVAGVINIVRAKLETFIEGAGGRYFNLKDAAKAEGIYFQALGSGDFFEDLKGGKPSFLSEMLIEYDGIQGELIDELGKKIPGSLANKLFRRNHLFLMQQGGEHYVQTQLMVAMMLHEKVKLNSGEEISLYEAKRREYKGTLKMSDTDWTSQSDMDFRSKVKFVNTNMHGNYNKLDKALLQRKWWGSLLLMFRKHIYTGFASRYRAGYVNYQTGNYTEGYYRTFMKGLVNQVRGLIEQKRMMQMSEDEKYAFRKIVADFAALAMLMFAFKAFDDDDDDEEFNDYMALISRRLISEGVQYTPVVGTLDLAKVVTNPAASVSTVDKVWDAVSQSISDPSAEYERSGPGYQVGQNKAAVKWGRALPLYRQYINTVEPERLLQFYGKNSIWFLKPSAKKGEEGEQ